ncbi:Folate-biopterin transporter 1, chloroplastic [Hondaea fermentalgiana]|uniref:Folate-biopterin transporter 1, chloroplastic n=1 Tax=Hondaea fermentalgiana TaxID=2315210 RepID=A0A2R5GRP6_9STRA|nr:Folate-biopterin transporter 1, chloroplastic [Hondaea fermentalgiana]|eukprot:GBG33520.1 Folate-biopterin transporter 1, chloroplastic [Hondaea fermentalgiana]
MLAGREDSAPLRPGLGLGRADSGGSEQAFLDEDRGEDGANGGPPHRSESAGGREGPLPMEMETDPAGGAGQRAAQKLSAGALARDVLAAPANVAAYYRRLSEAFGWRFVAMVSIVYGLNQGMGEAFFEFGGRYLLSDEPPAGFGLNASRIESIQGFANVPWQIKSVYGIASDTFPIGGYHRNPYVIAAGALGVASWSALWIFPLGVGFAAIMLFLGNLSVASPDVMIDASVAERCRSHPNFASDLQTLCWASFGLGKIAASSSMGVLMALFGSRALFGLTTMTSVAMLIPALFNWITEQPRSTRLLNTAPRAASGSSSPSAPRYTTVPANPEALQDVDIDLRGHVAGANDDGVSGHDARRADDRGDEIQVEHGCIGKLRHFLVDPVAGPVYRLSFIVMGISIAMGIIAEQSDGYVAVFASALITTASIAMAVYQYEKEVSLRLAKASVYIFLAGAMQPTSSLMFLWSKHDERYCDDKADQCPGSFCPRPCFSEEFFSLVSVVGYVVFVVGTAMYNKYLSSWSYKRIWRVTQIALTLASLLDLIFVQRWNLALGIPDKAFVLGDEILNDLISRLNTMPLFVLAAATCPPGVEATLFALNMGLSNFGVTLGRYHGVGLMWIFGGVTGPNFVNLDWFVLARSLMRLLPILLIPVLVPDGTPQTETFEDVHAGTDDGEDPGKA